MSSSIKRPTVSRLGTIARRRLWSSSRSVAKLRNGEKSAAFKIWLSAQCPDFSRRMSRFPTIRGIASMILREWPKSTRLMSSKNSRILSHKKKRSSRRRYRICSSRIFRWIASVPLPSQSKWTCQKSRAIKPNIPRSCALPTIPTRRIRSLRRSMPFRFPSRRSRKNGPGRAIIPKALPESKDKIRPYIRTCRMSSVNQQKRARPKIMSSIPSKSI